MKPLRWQQRFEHYERSLDFLLEALKEKNKSPVLNAGIIKAYEMSFELAWKVLKDFLEHEGYQNVTGPRDALKESFRLGFVLDGHAWLQMLEERNLLTHTYDPTRAAEAVEKIESEYLKNLKALRLKFKNEPA